MSAAPNGPRYSPESCPETARRLDIINTLAASLEDPGDSILARQALNTLILRCHDSAMLTVVSFDMDLTLSLPDDAPGCEGPVDIAVPKALAQAGAVVGTCSDRPPSEQRTAAAQLGFSPHFAIPEELLALLVSMLPGARMIHVGDDEERDRRIARKANALHLWPDEIPKDTEDAVAVILGAAARARGDNP